MKKLFEGLLWAVGGLSGAILMFYAAVLLGCGDLPGGWQ